MNGAMVQVQERITPLDEFAICPRQGCKRVSLGVYVTDEGTRIVTPCHTHAVEERRAQTARFNEAARAALAERTYEDLEPELVAHWLAQLMEHFNKQWTREYRSTWIRSVSGRVSATQFVAACERVLAEHHEGPRYFPSADKIVGLGRSLVPNPPAHERALGSGGREQLLLAAGG